jgi:hypothetical protein
MLELNQIENNHDEIKWHEFMKDASLHGLVTIAHNISLVTILSKTFGYRPANYLIMDSCEIVGVLPGVFIGKKFVSIPHFSYGGPIFKNEKYYKEFIAQKPYEIRSFKKLSKFNSEEKVSVYLSLQQCSSDEMFNSFKSKLKSQIRKGYSYGVNIKTGKQDLLSDFYLVYSKNMLNLGSPPLPQCFFANIFKYYTYGEAAITVVEYNNILVAAGFTISYLGFEEVCWASSNRKYNNKNFNMVLYWEMIKKSIETNNRYFSFGRSSKESNTLRFKIQWGDPTVKQLFFNFSENKVVQINKIKFLSSVWRLLPYPVTVCLSKYISSKIY